MNRIAIRTAALMLVVVLPASVAADDVPIAPATSQPADWSAWIQSEAVDPNWGPEENAEASRLLQQLSSPKFELREVATEKLRKMGVGLYRLLIAEYRASRDLEQRMRIREIAYELFMDQKLPWFNAGFIGIQMQQRAEGMLISRVLAGTAADRGGLEPYDIIVEVDGVRVPPDPDTREFAAMVSTHRAGEQVSLLVLRTGEVRDFTLTLGRRTAFQQLPERRAELRVAEEEFEAIWQDAFRADGDEE